MPVWMNASISGHHVSIVVGQRVQLVDRGGGAPGVQDVQLRDDHAPRCFGAGGCERSGSSSFAIQVARICPDGSASMSEFHIAANAFGRRCCWLSGAASVGPGRVDLASAAGLLLQSRDDGPLVAGDSDRAA
jgi:hypothetical protein